MYKILDFIRWALTKVRRDSIPTSARLLLPVIECGTDQWEYLFGSVRVQTNQATIDRYYEQHYYKQFTRAQYNAITASWKREGYATDCQGLLDAYLTYVKGVKTDWNADYNYKYVCEEKGEIENINRHYVIGEAVFIQAKDGSRMTHIGWVCGFTDSGTPLVVEARSIKHGVVITSLNNRWTHRGLMTKRFDYTEPTPTLEPVVPEPIKLELTNPMMHGNYVLFVQNALNALHYTDSDGKTLEEDGKCGQRTMQAVRAFANAHAVITEPAPAPEPVEVPVLPPVVGRLDLESAGIAVCAFRVDDLPVSGKNEVKRT